MNKLKRLLALTICLLLTLTSLPVTQLVASADTTANGLVVFHETTFNSVDDITWTEQTLKNQQDKWNDHITASVDENGYYTFTQTNTVGTGTNSQLATLRSLGELVIAKDDTNRTEVVTNNINGKYTIEFDLETLVKKYPDTSNPYYVIELFSNGSKVLLIRLYGANLTILDADSVGSTTYKRATTCTNGEWVYAADSEPQSFKLKLVIDTVKKTLSSYYNDVLMTSYGGNLISENEDCAIRVGKPIDSIRVFGLSRTDVDSYVKFKEVKITQNERATNTTLSALPAKLEVADVNNVTETSVTLPTVSGVTWASADTATATVSGNTLTLIPSEEGTKEAKVTATFTTDGFEYVKTYSMTLAKAEEVVPDPDPGETPDPEPGETPEEDEGIVSVNKIFNYADVTAALADGWSSNAENHSKFVIEDGAVKLEQFEQTVANPSDSTKANAGFGTTLTYKLPAGVVAQDDVNGTKIINEDGKYTGIVKVDIDGVYSFTPVDKTNYTGISSAVSPAFAHILISGDKSALQWRVRPTTVVPLSNSNEGQNNTYHTNIYAPDGTYSVKTNPEKGILLGAEVDMTKQTVTATIGDTILTGDTWAKNNNKPSEVTYISNFTINQMQRFDVGSYSKIKSVKVTTIDPKFGTETTAVLEQLPATLLNDIDNTTELSVTLPAINGVTWTSLNENAAKVNGNTLTLIPSKTETKDAVVKATFTTDGIKYSKEYTFTIAVNDNLAVTYYVDGSVYNTVSLKKNEKASSISAPAKTGYVFDGWYLDGANTAFDFETAITEDTKLYAKYSVDPDYNPTTDGVVAFSKTFDYANVSDALADGWTSGEENHAEFVVENGIPTLMQTKQTITENGTKATASFGTNIKYKFPAGPVAADLENRTTVINEDGKYIGTVKVDVDSEYDMYLSESYKEIIDGVTITVSASYGRMEIRGGAKSAVRWRIRASHAQAMSHTNEADTDIKDADGNKNLGGVPKDGVILSTTVDTVAETITATVPTAAEPKVATGTTFEKHSYKGDLPYIDEIYLHQMIRLPVGSYSKVKGITLTTLDPQFGTQATAKLNSLPATLDVRDINNVTERSIVLPKVDGVTWSSTSANVTIEDGVAALKREKGKTVEVTIKGTFTADGIKYSKEYAMTLAEDAYTINYYDINGEFYQTAEVKEGGKATSISAPAEENYSFIGWYEEDATTAFDFNTVITGDTNLYAKYEGAQSSVVFMADGNTVATLTGKFGGTVEGTIPAIPARSGFTAVGWYVGDTDDVFNATTPINSTNMIVKAKYAEGTLNVYTVTFKVDGVTYATANAVDGYAISSVPAEPSKDNYVFKGWMNGNSMFDINTPVTSNITLDAKFEPKPIKVKFFMDETMAELFKTETGKYGQGLGTLPTPSKDLYKFTGWKNADGTDFTKEQILTDEISVYATWEYAVKVILDEDITQYTSAKGNNVEFIDTATSWTESLFDDGYMVRVTKQLPTDRTITKILTAAIKAPLGEYDEVNRTQIYNSKFVGDYEIEIVYDSKLSTKHTAPDGTAVNDPYGYVSTGNYAGTSGFNALLANRLYYNRVQSFNSTSVSSNSFNATGVVGTNTSFTYPNMSGGVATDVALKIRYNTVEGKAYMTMNGSELVATGSPMTKLGFINAFYFTTMPCNQVGDYIKIKRVKVIQYNDYSDSADFAKINEIFAELPDSVVENPYDAKGTLTLPVIRGVKWSSDDETIVNTTTGEIKPWYNDIDVVIKATITSGIFSYEKFYTLTVKGIANETEEIINETFTSEEDLENWEFVNLEDVAIGDYSVDENGVKISKISPVAEPDKTYETKRYFGFYDLYDEVEASDYTVTEVKDHEGVYDVTVDYSKFSASKLPVNIAVGYRNGNTFYDFGMLKINSEGTYFAYQETGETKATVLLNVADSAKITFRIDNINKEICLFKDGELITDRYSFKTVMGDSAKINSVKVELDTNNEFGDYVTVKGISVTKIVGNTVTELNSMVNAAANIDVYDITANPQSVSGTINNLPSKIGGYDVAWSASSNQIDLETGEVFHDTTAKKVYLYAKIYDADAKYPYVVRKTFELNVRAAANSQETAKFVINSLGRITNQNYDDIRYDLNLPMADGITWTSSDTSIIDNNGILNKNKVLTSATPVTITASSNGVSKEYKLTVSPRTALQTVATGTDNVTFTFGNVSNAKVSGDLVASFTYTKGAEGKVNVVDANGNILVSLVSDADGFHFDYNGSDYKKYDLATAEIDIIVMPDVDKAAIFVDDALVADYVSVKFSTDYITKVEAEFDVGEVTLSMDKFGILQSNIDNFEYFDDVTLGYAGKDGINLPTTALTNATVTWTSSDTSILSNNGTVTTPNIIKNVNLTFKLADNSNADIYISRDFVISVDCANDKNLVYNNVPDVDFKDPTYHHSNSTDGNANTIYKVLETDTRDFDIVFNLGETKIFNTMYILQPEAKMQGYEIYSSNDGSVWNLITTGDMTGKCSDVIRFENTTASYVKLVVKKCNDTEIDIAEIKLFFGGSALELAQYDIDNISIDTVPSGTKINLPNTGANGTEFTWTSSDEKVIDNDGNITRPSNATTVKLTVKTNVSGQELSKTFDVYVDTKTSSGPSQVGGGSGGSGGGGGGGAGGGMASGGAATTPVIGETEKDTVYSDELDSVETVTTNVYNDVKETDWYYDAVKTLTSKGIVSGDGTGYFYPTNNVTREQFVKMILEAIEVEVTAGDVSFADVTSGAWYENYIATAVSKGIVNGVGDGNFGVGTNITRQDMAVLIERVLNFKNIEVEKAEVEPFADASSVADYAKDAVANMKAIGLIKGYDNNYNPKDNLTRAEAATVISTLLELLAK